MVSAAVLLPSDVASADADTGHVFSSIWPRFVALSRFLVLLTVALHIPHLDITLHPSTLQGLSGDRAHLSISITCATRSMLIHLCADQDREARQTVDDDRNTALNAGPETQPGNVDQLFNILKVLAGLLQHEGAKEGDDDGCEAGGEGETNADFFHEVDLEVPD